MQQPLAFEDGGQPAASQTTRPRAADQHSDCSLTALGALIQKVVINADDSVHRCAGISSTIVRDFIYSIISL
jgi:hypothetical protein